MGSLDVQLKNNIDQKTIDDAFLTSPGEDLVAKTLLQLSSVKGMVELFGKYTPKRQDQRWADYQRMDWGLRQLPAINIFEAQTEDKTSDQAWLNGSIQFQIFWPANFRRSDLARVPSAFKGVLQNFFSSKYVTSMLDELYFISRPQKVYGLNEYGKVMNWSPQTEGLVESELVPVTILDVRYRIDLRSWNRALEFMGRTKEDPFEVSLANLTSIVGGYDGVNSPQDFENNNIAVEIPDQITVTNP